MCVWGQTAIFPEPRGPRSRIELLHASVTELDTMNLSLLINRTVTVSGSSIFADLILKWEEEGREREREKRCYYSGGKKRAETCSCHLENRWRWIWGRRFCFEAGSTPSLCDSLPPFPFPFADNWREQQPQLFIYIQETNTSNAVGPIPMVCAMGLLQAHNNFSYYFYFVFLGKKLY